MPELPDLVSLEERLHGRFGGALVESVEVKNPVVMRCLGGVAPPEFLRGQHIDTIAHQGPFLVVRLLKERFAIFHPMLAGRFSVDGQYSRAVCLRLHTDKGVLSYHDEKQMGKVYLATAAELGRIPKFEEQGIDILSPVFTADVLNRLMGRTRRQVRAFLMDQTLLSSIGNAYADEILYSAGIHPKTPCSGLSVPDRERLHESIVSVMRWAIQEVARARSPLHEKVRGHMRVRNRKGDVCTRCGSTIRRESVLGHDTFFCPQCQPPTRPGFIDWSKTDS